MTVGTVPAQGNDSGSDRRPRPFLQPATLALLVAIVVVGIAIYGGPLIVAVYAHIGDQIAANQTPGL